VALVLSNTRSDRVKAVRRLTGRSAREREGLFLVEGPQAVREALAAQLDGYRSTGTPHVPGGVRDLYLTPEAAERFGELRAAAREVRLEPRLVTPEVLALMAGDDATVNPQGVLAVCALVASGDHAAALDGRPPLVAVLAGVQDPGNAGTIIRTADAAGAGAVILTAGSVDVHNPKCVRSTAGSLFHLPIGARADLPLLVRGLRDRQYRVLAADGAGDRDLDGVLDAGELAAPTAWLFGNEANGLTDEARELADDVVRIPIHGRAESLNVATAAAVCLYATARAQRPRR
jgi:TrmH family RNA methyltransferase